jgi:hypothetical protein
MSLVSEAYRLCPSRWIEDNGLLLDYKGQPVTLDEKQKQILDSSAPQVVLLCHRQWGKSSLSALLCLHRAIFFERSLCLLVAPSLRQSSENFRRVESFMEKLDLELVEDTKLSCQLPNRSRIIALPGGDEGNNVRGYSAPSIVVEDESSICSDPLYEAIRPMLISNPESRIILAATAHGQKGHFYKIWTEEKDWLKIFVPVTETSRFSPERLDQERIRGALYFRQEFLCEFLADEFTVFTEEMLKKMSVGDEDDEDNKEVNIFDY